MRARGALPYELNFVIEAVDLVPSKKVAVRTVSDFEGLWTATLSQRGKDVHVDLMWQVTVLRPILKFLAPVLRPAFAWNHRWTTPRGEKGLREYLAERKRSHPPLSQSADRLCERPCRRFVFRNEGVDVDALRAAGDDAPLARDHHPVGAVRA